MKIAVSAMGQTKEDKMNPRFGRCDGFVIYDSESDSYSYVDNSQNVQLGHGAGIQTGQLVASQGVDAVISGSPGPKATDVLKAAGIKIFEAGESTIEDVVKACLNSSLKERQ